MKLAQLALFLFTIALLPMVGCASFIGSSKEEAIETVPVELPETVGETTRPHGLGNVAVESVALVTGLAGTGSDPPPSQQRHLLLEDMKKRSVDNPNQVLADSKTSLVLVRAVLPPAVQRGDPIDIEVRVPNRSKTTSLEGGWLMETRLHEVAVLDREVHSGHVRCVAEGPVLVESLMADAGNSSASVRGQVLGGGVATKSRPLGLMLRGEHHSVSISKLVGAAVNQRFDTYVHGKRQGAATPKTDKFIELAIHPRYRHNLIRYLRVIEQIQLRENAMQRIERLKLLESDLLVPSTAAISALKLEAIGEEATDVLLQGLQSPSPEVRFYASEALAYLDHAKAPSHLAESVEEPAFRFRALNAMAAMSRVEAHDELTKLLHAPSTETRYGAFKALQHMNPRDTLLGQEVLGGNVYVHQVASHSEPLVHVTSSSRPEIVMFGASQRLETPLMVLIGKRLIVKSEGGAKLRVTRYQPGEEDQTRVCRPTVNDLVRTLVEMKTSYPEIVRTLHEARSQGCLTSRLAFDAVPKTGRTYERLTDG